MILSLDKSKLILLPSGNTLKWDGYYWVGGIAKATEEALHYVFGETIQQIDPRWYDGLLGESWNPCESPSNGVYRFAGAATFRVEPNGSAWANGFRFATYPTPAKAIEVINALIEAEQ